MQEQPGCELGTCANPHSRTGDNTCSSSQPSGTSLPPSLQSQRQGVLLGLASPTLTCLSHTVPHTWNHPWGMAAREPAGQRGTVIPPPRPKSRLLPAGGGAEAGTSVQQWRLGTGLSSGPGGADRGKGMAIPSKLALTQLPLFRALPRRSFFLFRFLSRSWSSLSSAGTQAVHREKTGDEERGNPDLPTVVSFPERSAALCRIAGASAVSAKRPRGLPPLRPAPAITHPCRRPCTPCCTRHRYRHRHGRQ